MPVRFAEEKDLPRINELRKQVNDLHVNNEPAIFKAGFSDELRDHIYTLMTDPQHKIAVAERDGIICGFAVLAHVERPASPYTNERRYLNVIEFGVDEACRRNGVGSELMSFIRSYAAENGFRRIELDMWEFNRGALKFYEAAGFSTYRRYMCCELPDDQK